MKREVFIHFAFWFSYFVLLAFFKDTFTLSGLAFWIGGVIGTILPDIDHILYIYLIKPYELTSQRFTSMLQNKELRRAIVLLYETREERKNLIFHSQFFQALFLVVTFWVMSSSGSLFGQGVAIAFALHLAVDQMIDIYDLGRYEDKKERLIWLAGFVITLLIGFI